MADKILDCFKGNAGNWIYIFISDSGLASIKSYRPAMYRVVAQKRLDQQKYITSVAQETKYTYADIKNSIAQRIRSQYGKTAGECINDFLNGRTVTGVNGYTIGGVRVGAIGAGIGAKVDPKTGVPTSSTIKQDALISDDGKYEVVYDCETEKPLGVYKVKGDSGELGRQVSYYDEESGTFKSGSKASNEFWSEACVGLKDLLLRIIEWIGTLFGVKTSSEVSALQSDGWVSSRSVANTSSTGNGGTSTAGGAAMAAGAAIVALALLSKKKSGKRHKRE